MPRLTRWTIKTALVYLAVGLGSGLLYWANQQWDFAPVFSTFSPTYLHLITVGWLTQLIYGVIYWMFPIIRKDNMRGSPAAAWSVYLLLNSGLILRTLCEPWRGLEINDVNGIGLVISAFLQAAAGIAFVAVCWPRVRERAGK
jgi:hypothetical protein